MQNAQKMAVELVAEFESFRAYPYPDPASPLARATRGQRWGFVPAREILARLTPATTALSGTPWTIGYGQTGRHITLDTQAWSESLAKVNLHAEVELRVQEIRKRAKAAGAVLTEGQVAALASFLFNCGAGNLGLKDGLFELRSAPRRPSTLWQCVIAGRHPEAAAQFLRWDKAGGVRMAGLTRRREAERKLYLRVM